MALTKGNANKARQLAAWESLSPDRGVQTRRRSKIKTENQSAGTDQAFPNKGNNIQEAQQDLSAETSGSDSTVQDEEHENHSAGARIGDADYFKHAMPIAHSDSTKVAVTTQQNEISAHAPTVANPSVSMEETVFQNEFKIHEDGQEVKMAGSAAPGQSLELGSASLKHTSELFERKTIASEETLLQFTEDDPSTDNQTLLSNNTFDDLNIGLAQEDSSSDTTVVGEHEGMNELKARNEDVVAENQYYRLVAEVALKTAALRRGCSRSAIPPSDLSPRLRRLHYALMTDGVEVPHAAADRAHVVADVIRLHLTWDVHNLQHCINAAAGVNSFVDFAVLFVPQIKALTAREFVGGEDNPDVHIEISAALLDLICWLIDQIVTLAEALSPPQYSSDYHHTLPVGWYDEGAKAMRDIDSCLEAICQHHTRVFSRGTRPTQQPQQTELNGYSSRILEWAYELLTWVNRTAGRLQTTVGLVTDQYGVKVELFMVTRQSLKNFIKYGTHHRPELAEQLAAFREARDRAMAADELVEEEEEAYTEEG